LDIAIINDEINIDDKSCIEYQIASLARKNVKPYSCLLELLPLPSQKINDWKYKEWSDLPYLENRATYKNEILTCRIYHLKSMADQRKPKAVIFYGTSYKKHWKKIADIDGLKENEIYERDGILFLMVKHPSPRAHENKDSTYYYRSVGERLSHKLKKKLR